jgi:hypothetical protein
LASLFIKSSIPNCSNTEDVHVTATLFGVISSTLLQIVKAHKKNGVESLKARTMIVAVADGWLRFWHMQDGKLVCEYNWPRG